MDREPLVCGVHRRSFRHRPAFENTFCLEPKVVMEPTRVMLLHNEDRLAILASRFLRAGLGGPLEVPLGLIVGKRTGSSHDPPLAIRFLAETADVGGDSAQTLVGAKVIQRI